MYKLISIVLLMSGATFAGPRSDYEVRRGMALPVQWKKVLRELVEKATGGSFEKMEIESAETVSRAVCIDCGGTTPLGFDFYYYVSGQGHVCKVKLFAEELNLQPIASYSEASCLPK